MRWPITCGLILSTVSCASHGDPHRTILDIADRPQAQRNVYCFVDDRTVSCEESERLARESIDHILILQRNAAAERFGSEADGAILVYLNGRATAPATRSDLIYYFINGRTASRADYDHLPRETIQGIEIVMSSAAIERFGPEAAAGVLRITTKSAR